MAKYDSIPKFLSRKHNAGILLTFGEIERIIGAALPRAAAQPGWWADAGSVQSDAWRSAGYRAELVPDIEAVWFRRLDVEVIAGVPHGEASAAKTCGAAPTGRDALAGPTATRQAGDARRAPRVTGLSIMMPLTDEIIPQI